MTPIAHFLATLDVVPDGTDQEGNILVLCPFRDERTPSCSVNLTSGLFQCFGCGKGGTLVQFVAALQHLNTLQAGLFVMRALNEEHFTVLPERDMAATYMTADIAAAHSTYLRAVPVDWFTLDAHYLLDTRHFEPGTLEHFKVRINPAWMYSILIPLTVQQRFLGYVCRRPDEEGISKYKNSRGFPREQHLVADLVCGPVLVTEGMFDRMRAWEYGFSNGAAVMGSHVSDAQYDHLLRYASEVLVGFDADEAGAKNTHALIKRLKADGKKYVCFPWQAGQHDLDKLSSEEFRETITSLGYGKLLREKRNIPENTRLY
jgi:hypothetical protein